MKMAALLNISKTNDKPLYIDPSDITALEVDPEAGELRLYNSKDLLLWIKASDWNVDAADIVQKLSDNGTPLVCFPARCEGKEYPHFVSTWEKGKRGYKNARSTYFRVDFSDDAWAYYSGRELTGHKFGNWQTVELLPDSLAGEHHIAGHNIADKNDFEENALGILRQSGLEAFVLELERNSK